MDLRNAINSLTLQITPVLTQNVIVENFLLFSKELYLSFIYRRVRYVTKLPRDTDNLRIERKIFEARAYLARSNSWGNPNPKQVDRFLQHMIDQTWTVLCPTVLRSGFIPRLERAATLEDMLHLLTFAAVGDYSAGPGEIMLRVAKGQDLVRQFTTHLIDWTRNLRPKHQAIKRIPAREITVAENPGSLFFCEARWRGEKAIFQSGHNMEDFSNACELYLRLEEEAARPTSPEFRLFPPKLPALLGIVEARDKVAGFLLQHIDGCSMTDFQDLEKAKRFQRWHLSTQVRSTVNFLHSHGMLWEANDLYEVWIEPGMQNAWLMNWRGRRMVEPATKEFDLARVKEVHAALQLNN
ncbi:hypothetical protein FQN50_008668 [Emmonsiellopsis sp. PD_5]|nr:hypothetical protein FQN50_008668 [Emmonsiellopsis sp. PD_5]